MVLVKKSNLPETDIALAAVSKTAQGIKAYLKENGIAVVEIEPSSIIRDGTAAHADLHILHLGGERLILSREQQGSAMYLSSLGFSVEVLSSPLGSDYPNDVPLNAAVIGSSVILNSKTVTALADFTDFTAIPVRQGYAKCSVTPVDEHSLITDDSAIAEKAAANGFDVLLVSKGDVRLPGREYGFIGGCCGLVAPDKMLFNGSLTAHRDGERIEEFLSAHGIACICVGEYPLTDIGGILPLAEKER